MATVNLTGKRVHLDGYSQRAGVVTADDGGSFVSVKWDEPGPPGGPWSNEIRRIHRLYLREEQK